MKKKLLGLALGLFLIVPQLVMANGSIPEKSDRQGVKPDGYHHGHHQMTDKQWQEKLKAKEQKLLSLVNQYTPDKKDEWAKVISERNKLRAKWLSPEFAKKREQWKKEKMQKMAEQNNLHDKGKMQKEEFRKKAPNGMKMGHWKMYHELKTAVENNNDKQAAKLLNQILIHYQQHNEMLKKAMNE